MSAVQSYKSHTGWDPVFHFFIAPILLLNIVATSVWYGHHRYQHMHSGMWLILISVVLLMVALKMREYAIKVQDRVIRLEERFRLAALATPSELIELESLTTDQL